ncbi:hypothetical protein TELCIR_18142, partial [Teladorsagia circumcincta]
TWDCNLENLANEAVANCPSAVTPNPSFGQAFTYDIGNGDVLYDVGTPCITDGDCTASPFEAVKSWWDLRNKIDRDVMTALLDNRNVSNPATEFVELTRGNYTHVGCAVAGNELNYNVVCAYKLSSQCTHAICIWERRALKDGELLSATVIGSCHRFLHE